MVLAESQHHTSRGQKTARAGGETRVALHGHVPEAPLPQGRVLRHVVGHLPVPALDVPVPQMVDQLPDIEQFFRALSPVPEQVIEVPKILPLDVPMRAALRVTQLVEQLVEVPTILSYSSLLQRTVEQHVDIPVPGGGGGPSSGLQGFSSGQRSTASPSKKRISERIVEQIVDPVSSGRLQGSSSSHSPAGDEERADEPGKGGFRTFPQNKKSAKLGSHSGSELLPELSPFTRAPQPEDSVEWVRLRNVNSGKPYYWNRRTRASAWKPPPDVKVVWFGGMNEEGRRLSSRLLPCPRSLWTGSHNAARVVDRGEQNSWWRCLRSYQIHLSSSGLPSRQSTFQFLRSRRSWLRGRTEFNWAELHPEASAHEHQLASAFPD